MRRSIITVIILSFLCVVSCKELYNKNPEQKEEPRASAPVFTVPAGTYNGDVTVGIVPTGGDSRIFYWIDGSYKGEYFFPIAVKGDGTAKEIKAVAKTSGKLDSEIVAATYTIFYHQVAPVGFNPPGNVYNSNQAVKLTTNTAGASIYYYINDIYMGKFFDGSSITVENDGTVMKIAAFATKDGMKVSQESSATYEISFTKTPPPTFSPAPLDGYYLSNTDCSVSLSNTNPSAKIYYYVNDAYYGVYKSPIQVQGDGTKVSIRALAKCEGMSDSKEISAIYEVKYNITLAPKFHPEPGTYLADQDITITGEAGSIIHYSLDQGVTYSEYNNEIIELNSAGAKVEIWAYATMAGKTDSEVVKGLYYRTDGEAPEPLFSPSEGTYDTDINVNLSNALEGSQDATIYLSLDGGSSWLTYTTGNPIAITGNGTQQTIVAYAHYEVFGDSTKASRTYKIAYNSAAIPDFNPGFPEGVNSGALLEITVPPGYALRYSDNKGVSWNDYTDKIELKGSKGDKIDIWAKSLKGGMTASDTIMAEYTIEYR